MFLKALKYILPGTTIEIYWSDAVILKKIHVATVEATSEPVDFANFITLWVIRISKPADSITPPKTIAVIISQIVSSIPAIPLVVRSSFTAAF